MPGFYGEKYKTLLKENLNKWKIYATFMDENTYAITEIREVPILIYKCNKILNQNPKSSWNLISWSENSYVTAKGKNSQEITEEEQEYPDIKTYV